ncbi:MAG: hypothetical protein COY82_02030, partial [Parcubacteria group bacterium CG_4_10_14_0_8_um_filter_35_7]
PSWQGTLGNALGRALPLDPVNRIGECEVEGYDSATCWNDEDLDFMCPANTYAFQYKVLEDGAAYELSTFMEYKDINWEEQGFFDPRFRSTIEGCALGMLKVYSVFSDWDIGEKTNVTHFNSVKLKLKEIETPYLWVANSGEDTIEKISTSNGESSGEYSVGSNPSRTAVDIDGNVWVANRNSHDIVKLRASDGVVLKRCSLKVEGSYPYGYGPRGVAIDISGDVWIGTYSGDAHIIKLSGDDSDCSFKQTVDIPIGCCYGAVIDSQGYLYISNRCSGAVNQIDTTTGQLIKTFSGIYSPYGIAVDKKDNVWVANYEGSAVTKINPSTEEIIVYSIGKNYSRGVAVDSEGYVWVNSDSDGYTTKLNPDNGEIVCQIKVGCHPIGLTPDAQGNIWVINYSGGGPDTGCEAHGSASKINAKTCEYLDTYPVGTAPYTYSDMAGYALRNITLRSGIWRADFDSGKDGTHWYHVYWEARLPEDTSIKIRARSARSQEELSGVSWTPYFDASPADISSLLDGRWLQVEANLYSRTGIDSPELKNLILDYS